MPPPGLRRPPVTNRDRSRMVGAVDSFQVGAGWFRTVSTRRESQPGADDVDERQRTGLIETGMRSPTDLIRLGSASYPCSNPKTPLTGGG